MKALIIATSNVKEPESSTKVASKPLLQLLGLSLIERVILASKKAGIGEFIIITDNLGEKIRAKLKDGSEYGIRIDYVEDKELERGEIIPITKIREKLKEKFVLLMADCIFDVNVLKGLIRVNTDRSIALIIDGENSASGGIRTLEKNGKILDMGDEIRNANCLCAKMFLCSPKVLHYFEETMKEGKTKFVDCIVKAARNDDVEILEISSIRISNSDFKIAKPWWVEIKTTDDLKIAERFLIKSIQKRNHFAAYYNAPIEDKITIFISKYSWITPNRVSILTNIFAYCVTYLFLTNYLLIASVLTFIVSVFDGVDGKLARLKYMETKVGKLEHSFDFLWEVSWIIAFSIALLDLFGNLPLFLCLTILPFDFFNRHIFMQFKSVMGDLRGFSRFDRIFGLIDGRRNTYLWYILAGVILNQPIYSFLAILSHATVTSIVYAIRTLQHASQAR